MPQTTKVFRSLADLAPRQAKLPFRVRIGGDAEQPRLEYRIHAADSVSAFEHASSRASIGERVEIEVEHTA